MGNYLKHLIVGCATLVAIVNMWIYGDGTTMTALFGLYGAILGVEVAKKGEAKTE